MRILVDAMGGDNAPDQIALGAIQAAKDFGCETVLVGRGEAILQALKDQGIETLPKGVEIANADDVVDMHDDPATVVKKKKDSSMVVGLTMLKEGGGDAFVSAGSTGALLSAATLIVRRVKGIRRAGKGAQKPPKTGKGVVHIDIGGAAASTPVPAAPSSHAGLNPPGRRKRRQRGALAAGRKRAQSSRHTNAATKTAREA